MGCYVLLKSRLVKETRDSISFTTNLYTIYEVKSYLGMRYGLIYSNHWNLMFDSHQISHLYFIKGQKYYYTWYNLPRPEIEMIANCLAECRFDLVYLLINKII